jgi:hypothetical protein
MFNEIPTKYRILLGVILTFITFSVFLLVFQKVVQERIRQPDYQGLEMEELMRRNIRSDHSDTVHNPYWRYEFQEPLTPPFVHIPRISNDVDLSRIQRPRELWLRENQDEVFKQLNIRAYEIANTYMKAATNLHEWQRDPLILLAMSRVELGVVSDINRMYSAAIPTVGIDLFWPEMVDEYGSHQTMYNDAYWRRISYSSAMHQGPLQMGVNYGVSVAAVPRDLVGNEYNHLLTQHYRHRYNVPTSWFTADSRNSGDRYNWADACNRTAGVFNYWARFYNDFDNIYEYIALAGMAHNVGGSLFTSRPTTVVTQNFFPWVNVGAARDFAKQVASPEIVMFIRETVNEDIENWRAGRQRQPNIGRGHSWGYSVIINSGLVDRNLFTLKGDYMVRLSYPVKLIYYYELMRELYYNGR